MKLINLFAVLIAAMIALSCNDDDDGDVGQVDCATFGSDTEVQAAVNNFTEAATNYGQNPTIENCNAYLNALDNYFEVIDVYVNDCYNDEAFDQWRDAVDQWRAERDQLDCDS